MFSIPSKYSDTILSSRVVHHVRDMGELLWKGGYYKHSWFIESSHGRVIDVGWVLNDLLNPPMGELLWTGGYINRMGEVNGNTGRIVHIRGPGVV